MDIRIDIGRDVAGEHAFRVPSSFTAVSRQHATLYWHNGVATLEDHSSYGTFVNGQRISKANVTENDTVWLGGIGTYRLDLRQLFALIPDNSPGGYPPISKPVNPHGDNYAREFVQLKQTYISYHEELSKLKRKYNLRMQLPRVLISLIPILIMAIIIYIFRETLGMMSMVVMMGASVLGGLIGTLTMGRTSSKQEQLSEDILDLQLKYQNRYKCPKCGKPYSLDLHWKKLQADGKCPFGCGAKFI